MRKISRIALVLSLILSCSACTSTIEEITTTEYITTSYSDESQIALGETSAPAGQNPGSLDSSSAAQNVTSIHIDATFPPKLAQPDLPNSDSQTVDWYYSHLDTSLQEIYQTIEEAILEMRSGRIQVGNCTQEDLNLIYVSILRDHPEYFWLSSEYIIGKNADGTAYVAFDYTTSGNGQVHYLVTTSQRDQMRQELDQLLTELDQKAKGSTAYELELFLHDFVCETTEYNYGATNALDFTAYGALIRGSAVCEGYARAFQLLCNRYGLNCIPIVGRDENLQGHMWNMVQLGSQWYHVDTTWDDLGEQPLHTYFNLNDDMILRDHDFRNNLIESQYTVASMDNFHRPFSTSLDQCYFYQTGVALSKELEEAQNQIAYMIANSYGSSVRQVEFLIPESVLPTHLDSDWVLDYYDLSYVFQLAGENIYAQTGETFPGASYGSSEWSFWVSW